MKRLSILGLAALLIALACFFADRHLHAPYEAVVMSVDFPPRVPAATPAPAPERPARSRTEVVAPHLAAAELARAAEAVSRDLVGDVVDVRDAPIESAEVTLFDASDRVAARTKTDRAGAFNVAGGGATAVFVVVRHSAFATEQVVVPRPIDREPTPRIRIRMSIGAAIEGEVRLPSGAVPRSPIRVAAIKFNGGPFTLDQALAALQDDPRVATTVTDSAGMFRIEGLLPRDRRTMVAAGPGFGHVTKGGPPAVEAVAGGDFVHLTIAPLYVLDLRIRGSDGEPLETSAALGMWYAWTQVRDELDTFGPSTPTMQWAEIPGLDAARADTDDFRMFLVMAGRNDAERLGPIELSASPPGYRHATASLYAVRVGSAAPATQEIRLQRIAAGFGTLRVRLGDESSGLCDLIRTSTALGGLPFLTLKLYPTDKESAGSFRLNIGLRNGLADPVDLSGIPVGAYRAFLDVRCGSPGRTSEQSVTIVSGSRSELVFDVPTWAALDVNPTNGDTNSKAYDGPLVVTLRRSGTQFAWDWAFKRRPYRVVGFGPGLYDLSVRYGSRATESIPVSTTAGVVARVDVVLK